MTCNWPPLGIDPSWSGIFQCCKCQNSSGLHYYCNKNWIVNGCSSWFRSMLGLAFAILNVCFPSDGAQGKGGLDYGRIAHSSQSWTALSSSLNLSLGSGGCASVVWGKIQRPLVYKILSYSSLSIRPGYSWYLQYFHCRVACRIPLCLSYVSS